MPQAEMLSRRELFRIARRFGAKGALFAAATGTGLGFAIVGAAPSFACFREAPAGARICQQQARPERAWVPRRRPRT